MFGIAISELKSSDIIQIFSVEIITERIHTAEKIILYMKAPFLPHKNSAAQIPYAPHPKTEDIAKSKRKSDKRK